LYRLATVHAIRMIQTPIVSTSIGLTDLKRTVLGARFIHMLVGNVCGLLTHNGVVFGWILRDCRGVATPLMRLRMRRGKRPRNAFSNNLVSALSKRWRIRGILGLMRFCG